MEGSNLSRQTTEWTVEDVSQIIGKQYNDEVAKKFEDLSLQGAKLIITVMFSAIKYGDVSKQQLLPGTKKFKLSCNTSSKDSMAEALAKTLLRKNFVKINSANFKDFKRDKVQKLQVY
ncbi:hypothetical protein AWC38_SpisGene20093 [Stylophora pistillata]|uniref:Uncharacterized protein n=1 Tax=Stylophora pistillata TaxID=50429 RepID=A0A2B4RFS6_STYPI|nr:hypothetical protein AWC38_SpisGene20093 [Stylophora pistillata]